MRGRRASRARAHLLTIDPLSLNRCAFMLALAALQEDLLQKRLGVFNRAALEAAGLKPGPATAGLLPVFLAADVPRVAPPTLAVGLEAMTAIDAEQFADLTDTYWQSGGREPRDSDELQLFVVEAILQPYAEQLASEPTPTSLTSPTSPTSLNCPRLPARRSSPCCAKQVTAPSGRCCAGCV